jgi:acyl-CoA thioester hydrolase
MTAHEWQLRVYWEDTDAGGVVFYANYLKYFERARTEWLRSLGFEQQALRETTGGMFVVTETTVRYHHPARLDDQLIAQTILRKIGKLSASIGQSLLLKSKHSPGTPEPFVLCAAQIQIAWVDAASFKPTRMPADLAQALLAVHRGNA